MAKSRLTARFYQDYRFWYWELLDDYSVVATGETGTRTKEEAWADLKRVLNVQRLEIEGYEEVA